MKPAAPPARLAIFRPPFNGLWLLAVAYFAACYLLYPGNQALKGQLPDPDDYMYLTQVMDWLHGQGWYDAVQHRLNPPEGTPIDFSRLTMVPMAALTLLFKAFGQPDRAAAISMAMLYPVLLLAGFFVVLRKAAANVIPQGGAGLTAYTALFAMPLLEMFQPGHIDHHGLMVAVTAAAFGGALATMREPANLRWSAVTGIIMGVGLTLALEILPWLLLISGWLGLWIIAKGKPAARNGVTYALALWLTSILCLLLTNPPGEFFKIDLISYSIVYVVLTTGILICFGGIAAAANLRPALRLAAGLALAFISGGLYLAVYPQLVIGPYGALDPRIMELIIRVVDEALPMTGRLSSALDVLVFATPALIALAAGAYFFRQASRDGRWLWGLLLAGLAAATVLTVFCQSRFAGVMGMLAAIPFAALLQRGWAWTETNNKGVDKPFVRLALLLLLGPLPGVILPALATKGAFTARNVLLFPAANARPDECNPAALAQVLDDPEGLGDRQRLIVNDMATGPALLFYTRHTVLAAPYVDATANMDAYRLFATPYAEEANDVARDRHIDLIVSCANVPTAYTQANKERSETGIYPMTPYSFIVSLLEPGNIPYWLREIKTPGVPGFDVYAVLPPDGAEEKPAAPR